ncbi:unnamed protein product [Gongylonema pulchrum]|uniref:BZIP domain-containing protein n=1 Tax=Gongylonema pulchrum TaxID=637853 RepID=A0A183DUB5_9BILA|nr:unnamed protein product [Gongylonema pulchrum]
MATHNYLRLCEANRKLRRKLAIISEENHQLRNRILQLEVALHGQVGVLYQERTDYYLPEVGRMQQQPKKLIANPGGVASDRDKIAFLPIGETKNFEQDCSGGDDIHNKTFVVTSTPKENKQAERQMLNKRFFDELRQENKGATVLSDNRPIKPMSDADYRRYFLPSNEKCTSHRYGHQGAKHAAREQKVPERDIGSTAAGAVNRRAETKTDLGTTQKTAAGISQKYVFLFSKFDCINSGLLAVFYKTVISSSILWSLKQTRRFIARLTKP